MTLDDLAHLSLAKVLDALHRDGRREVYRTPDGRLWLRNARTQDDAPQIALKCVRGLSDYLQPWRCPCCGSESSVPSICDACHAALGWYSRGGARLYRGSTRFHSLRDYHTTHCGLAAKRLPDLRGTALQDLPAGELCRSCMRTLWLEYLDAHPMEPKS